MEINSIYELKDNWETLKDKIITYYEGDWLVSTENSYDNSIKLNNKLCMELRNQGWLEYINCTISHRAVSNYKFPYIVWDELEGLLETYRKLIKLVANKTFIQKHELETFLLEYDYKLYDSHVIDYRSYWGGARDEKALKIKHNGFAIYIPYGTSYRDNLRQKNALAKSLLISYCKLVGLPYTIFGEYEFDTWDEKVKRYRGFYKNLCKKIESGSWSDKFLEYEFNKERDSLLQLVEV